MLSLRPRRPKASGDDDNASFARAVSDNYWCIIGFAGWAECERSSASHSRLVLDASSARNAIFVPNHHLHLCYFAGISCDVGPNRADRPWACARYSAALKTQAETQGMAPMSSAVPPVMLVRGS